MPSVVILPHSTSDLIAIHEAILDCLGKEARDMKVLPLLASAPVHIAVDPKAEEPVTRKRAKKFILNQVQQQAMDTELYGLLKTHAPATMGTLLNHLRPSWPGVNDVAARKSINRLIEEGLAKYAGHGRSRLYEAL